MFQALVSIPSTTAQRKKEESKRERDREKTELNIGESTSDRLV